MSQMKLPSRFIRFYSSVFLSDLLSTLSVIHYLVWVCFITGILGNA